LTTVLGGVFKSTIVVLVARFGAGRLQNPFSSSPGVVGCSSARA